MRVFLSLIVLLIAGCVGESPDGAKDEIADQQSPRQNFEALMQELARGWNEGDAAAAAACFTEDAVYIEPPDKQLFRGRAELFEFFGGKEGRAGQMQMVWHHLVFDPEGGIGFGEFSFSYGSTAHGVVVVRLQDGKIANWREYWYASELQWEEFVANNPF